MKDKQLLRKEPEEAASVLNPKINGVMNLDYLTRGEPLDFFVLFSSITAILGQAGQSDYAYANAFLDSFAVFRNKQVEEGRRKGLTSSINWPYWSDGGMVISEKNKNTLKEKTGLGDITSKTALEVLTKVIEAGQPRLTLLAGDKKKLVDLFLTGEVKEKTGNPEIVN
jgi:hypothetical protein